MRIDEDKIFGAYVGSLIEESKKGGKLPPWLKSKKGEDKSEENGDKKEDKKDGKKDGKKKNLPPWLKGKKKKVVKEEVEMAGEIEFQIDNRDISTTWLTLPDGNYIEIDPWEILSNALENAGRDDLLADLEELKSKADIDTNEDMPTSTAPVTTNTDRKSVV